MSRSVARFRPQAERDVDEVAEHIARGSLEYALRFYAAVRADAARLAEFLGLGSVYGFSTAGFADIRFWPIGGFRKYLIFYRLITDGVEIVRVLHDARDVGNLMKS